MRKTKVPTSGGEHFTRLGDRDSNPNHLIQSQTFCRLNYPPTDTLYNVEIAETMRRLRQRLHKYFDSTWVGRFSQIQSRRCCAMPVWGGSPRRAGA